MYVVAKTTMVGRKPVARPRPQGKGWGRSRGSLQVKTRCGLGESGEMKQQRKLFQLNSCNRLSSWSPSRKGECPPWFTGSRLVGHPGIRMATGYIGFASFYRAFTRGSRLHSPSGMTYPPLFCLFSQRTSLSQIKAQGCHGPVFCRIWEEPRLRNLLRPFPMAQTHFLHQSKGRRRAIIRGH